MSFISRTLIAIMLFFVIAPIWGLWPLTTLLGRCSATWIVIALAGSCYFDGRTDEIRSWRKKLR